MQPDYADAYFFRGTVYDNLNNYKRAIEDYNQAIRLKTNYALAYNNLGRAYFLQSKNKLGCPDVQKACTLGICTMLESAKDKGYCH